MAQERCSKCGGSGYVEDIHYGGIENTTETIQCNQCHGRGYIEVADSSSSSSSSSGSSGGRDGSKISPAKNFSELCESEAKSFKEVYYNLQEKKKYEQAIALYSKFVKTYPCFSPAFHYMAECFVQLGQLQEALDYVNKAISLHSHIVYLITRMDIYITMGETEKADADLTRTVEGCIEAINNSSDAYVLDFNRNIIFNILNNRAKKGITRAYYGLGMCYNYHPDSNDYHPAKNNKGFEIDLTKAREWLEKSANTGDIDGIYDLGRYYYHGVGGLQRNKAKGLEYIRKAAKEKKSKNSGFGYTHRRARKWLIKRFIRDVLCFKGYGEATPGILTIYVSPVLWVLCVVALGVLIPGANFSWLLLITAVVVLFSVVWRNWVLLILEILLSAFLVFSFVNEVAGIKINNLYVSTYINNKTKANQHDEIDNQWAVIREKRNLMSEPNGGTVIKEIESGSIVTLTKKPSTVKKWISAEYEGDEGWIAYGKITYCNAEHEVKVVKGAGLYSEDGTQVVSIDDKKKRITLTGKTRSGYVEAEYNGVTGWILVSAIQTIP